MAADPGAGGQGDLGAGGQPAAGAGAAAAVVQTPAFDAVALGQQIQDSIKAGFEAHQPQPNHQPDPQYLRTQPSADADPVTRVIAPIVGPALQAVSLQAQAAMDAAVFYNTNPQASKLRDKIEAKFGETMQLGRPVPRQDIYQWMRGGPLFKESVEEEIKARADVTRQAELAATAGPGGRPSSTPGKDPHGMTDEELSAALVNLPF